MARFKTSIVVVALCVVALLWGAAAAYAAAAQLHGTVSTQAGARLPGATVAALEPAGGATVATAITAADGSYKLSLEDGAFDIRVTPPADCGFGSVLVLGRTVSGDTALDFILVPASNTWTLSGRVTAPDGSPVANQQVMLTQPQTGSQMGVQTDADGRYAFTTLAGQYVLRLNYCDPNYNPALPIPMCYDLTTSQPLNLSQDTVLDIALPFKRLNLHVQDSGGQPVANVGIAANPPMSNGGLNLGTLAANGSSSYRYCQPGMPCAGTGGAVTDQQGNVSLWLFPTFAGPGCNPTTCAWQYYTLTAYPPTGSPYPIISIPGLELLTDRTELIILQGAPLPPGPTITAVSPVAVQAGGSGFNLTVHGAHFPADAVVNWNDQARPTQFVSDSQLTAVIRAEDIAASPSVDLATARVTVTSVTGGAANAAAVTVTSPQVALAQTSLAAPGQTATASTIVQAMDGPAVSATLANSADAERAAAVTVAIYNKNPTGAPAVDVGGGYVDLRVTDAGPGSSMVSNFYCPSAITGEPELALKLLYFDGASWQPVFTSGHSDPLKDTQDNLDGTLSGGRFIVTFDSTSAPDMAGLTGTVLALTVADATAPAITPALTPPANAAGWLNHDGALVWTVSDPESGIAAKDGCADTPITAETAGATFTCTATNGAGLAGSASLVVRIDETPPAVNVATPAAYAVLPAGTALSFSASDELSGMESMRATLANGSSSTPVTTGATPGPGVYTLNVTARDAAGNTTIISRDFVVYDPNGGFVTGGGWINSPAGAYAPDPTLAGKATFGFVAKYQKGAAVPTGQTEFQFKVADLNFRSTAHEWLVVAGAKAQYKGTGSINGAGSYGFLLTATDSQLKGGGVDKFRIKIWDKAGGQVVYDNQADAPEEADPTTAIEGGSIVIHK